MRGNLNFSLRSRVPGDASRRWGLALLAIVIGVAFTLRHERYGTVSNFETIGVNMAPILIAAVGTMALILAGYLDLSIGSMYGLCAVIVAQTATHFDSSLLALGVGILSGAVFGAINGLFVRILPISPIIVTIGLLAVYRGAAYVVSEGTSVYGFPDSFTDFGRGRTLGIPTMLFMAFVVFAVGAVIITRTVPGLRIYAIGGDKKAAELNGVRTDSLIHRVYTANGALIGLVAAMVVARVSSADPNLGLQFELDVITAVILGGIAFNGGNGRPIGVLFGVAIIGLLNAGLVFEGLPDPYQQMAKGSVLLLALLADQYRHVYSDLGARIRAPLPWVKPKIVSDGVASHSHSTEMVETEASAAPASSTGTNPPTWVVQDLARSFGPVVALRGVSFEARPGAVTCLLGDNGAGKSTVVRILSGAETADSGSIRRGDLTYRPKDPGAARELGVETVYQDLALCTNLSSAHNLMLGKEPTWGPSWLRLRDDRVGERVAHSRLGRLGIALQDPWALVQSLSGGQRQGVAIAKALHEGVSLACFDEPTAALGVSQTRRVLESIRAVAAEGAAVIVITHDFATVASISDHLVALRLGEVIYDGPPNAISEAEILHLMGGTALSVQEEHDDTTLQETNLTSDLQG